MRPAKLSLAHPLRFVCYRCCSGYRLEGPRMTKVPSSFYSTFTHEFTDVETEPVPCNLCGSDDYTRLGEEIGFEIRRCRNCSLVYVSPQPTKEALPKFYEEMYDERSGATAETFSLGAVERHISAIVRRRKPDGGNLLDVGCGYGNLLRELRSQEWNLHGLEVSERAIEVARKQAPDAQFVQGTTEDADFAPESMDCVTMIAVLEHMKDPRAALRRVGHWLAPGGLLVVQVPYIQAFFRLAQRLPFAPAISFEAPRHLFDFSPKALPAYFRELGFKDIEREIARPFQSPTRLGAVAIWGVKLPGLLLYHLTGRRYIYPYAGAIVVHGYKPA